jgi:gingipain R
MGLKKFFIFFIFISAFGWSKAQNITVLNSNSVFTEVKIDFAQPIVTTQNRYVVVSVPNCTKLLEKGAPDVPKFSFSLAINNNSIPTIKVIATEFKEQVLQSPLLPSRGKILHQQNAIAEFVQDNKFYNQNFYPLSSAITGADYLIRNQRGYSFHIFPVQYQGSTKTLRSLQTITLRIDHNQGQGTNVIEQIKEVTPQVFDAIYRKHFINYAYKNSNLRYTPIEEVGTMLVLAPSQFVNAIQPFINWKKQKGIATKLVVVDTLAGGNNITTIKNFIADYYNQNKNAFVVIVGDHTNIPTYNEFGNNANFYSYGDNGYAYIKGADHYADVLIGRLSGATEFNIATQVNKIIAYEKQPNLTGNWLTTCLAIGSNDPTKGDDNQYDWQHARSIADTLINVGPFNSRMELFDGTQGGLDAPGNVAAQQVVDAINSGTSLFNYTGHGNAFGINTSGFNVSNIPQLNNSNGTWPAMITVGCSPGVFVNLACFAEEMAWAADVNGQPIGTIVNAMSTVDQYWDAPMQAQDEMNNILSGVYADNFKNTFGGIFFNGLFSMNENYDLPNDPVGGSDMADAWQVFGDPSIQLRNGNNGPITLTLPCAVSPSISTLDITCNVQDALVAVLHKNELVAVSNATGGVATLAIPAGILSENDTLTFTATKYNHAPFVSHSVVKTNTEACSPTSTTIKQNITSTVSVIESEKKIANYTVLNTLGQVLEKKVIAPKQTIVVNFSDYAPNIYYVKTIFTDGTQKIFKVLKK